MRSKNIILFDGVCNLCCASVNIIISNDPHSKFLFASLQSEFAKKHLKEYPEILKGHEYLDSIVLLMKGKVYTKSTAALLIAKKLKFPFPLLYALIVFPRFIRDWFYGIISNYRYKWFGKNDTCMIPTPEIRARFIE